MNIHNDVTAIVNSPDDGLDNPVQKSVHLLARLSADCTGGAQVKDALVLLCSGLCCCAQDRVVVLR